MIQLVSTYRIAVQVHTGHAAIVPWHEVFTFWHSMTNCLTDA